jgi:hypothetical protein
MSFRPSDRAAESKKSKIPSAGPPPITLTVIAMVEEASLLLSEVTVMVMTSEVSDVF